MDEKKSSNTSVITIILLLMIIIAILGCIIYKLYSDKQVQNKSIESLNAQLSNIETDKQTLQNKIDSISNTINDTNNQGEKYLEITAELDDDNIFCVTKVENSEDTYTLKGVLYTRLTISKTELDSAISNGYTINNTKYSVKKDYGGNEYAFVKDFNGKDNINYCAVKKDDNTYYINSLTEFEKVWKITDNYRQVSVLGNTIFEDEGGERIVSEQYENYKEFSPKDSTNPGHCVLLEFSNNKCTKIVDYPTGH